MDRKVKLFLAFSLFLAVNVSLLGQISNSQCYLCHSNSSLKKTITLLLLQSLYRFMLIQQNSNPASMLI